MSADQRVTMAREFLAGARKRRAAELPPSVLMREDAELRRLLGQVLDYVAEHEGRLAAVSGWELPVREAFRRAIRWEQASPSPDSADQIALFETVAARLGVDLGPGGAS